MSEQYKAAEAANVRMAVESDRDKLMDFVRDGHRISAIFSLSEKKIERIIRDGIYHNPAHPVIIGVIDAPDKSVIAASLCIEYTQPYYSDDWFLCELWNNVRPEYRRSHYGRDLFAFGKKISEDTNRPLAMSIITVDRLDAKISLYKRKMQQVGAFFLHNLDKCSGPAMTGVM